MKNILIDSKDLIIQKSEWILTNSGKNLKIYVDTQLAIQIINGVNSLYDPPGNFYTGFIEDKNYLIQSLFFSNFLPTIELLPPHQNEFARFIKRDGFEDFNFSSFSDSLFISNKIKGYLGKKKLKLINSFEENGGIINRDPLYSRFIYTVLLNPAHWLERFSEFLKDDNKINITSYDLVDIYAKIDFGLFDNLLNEYNSYRDDKSKEYANYNDALALTILSSKLERHINENTSLPIFYDPNGEFLKRVQSAKVTEKFEYLNKSIDQKVSVFKDADYFYYLAILSSQKKIVSGELVTNKIKYTDSNLSVSNLSESVELIDKFNSSKNFDYLSSISNLIHNNLQELQIDWFIIYIWLPYLDSIEDKLKLKALDLNELVKDKLGVLVRNNNFYSNYKRRLDNLEETTSVFHSIAKLWMNLKSNYDQFGSKIKFQPNFSHNVFKDYGLIRFSFPDGKFEKPRSQEHYVFYINEINDLVYNGLVSGKESTKQSAFNRLLKLIYNGIWNEIEKDLYIGMSVLWILELYIDIDRLLQRFEKRIPEKNYPHFSIALIHASSIAKLGVSKKRTARLNKIVSCISSKFSLESYKADIGLAYVDFIRWKHAGGKRFTTSYTYSNLGIKSNIIKSAIKKAEQSYVWLDENTDLVSDSESRILSKLYALNLFLYMSIEEGPQDQFKNLEMYIIDFHSFAKTYENNLWQERFDDTLARYYLRKSCMILNMNINIKERDELFCIQFENAKKHHAKSIEGTKFLDSEKEEVSTMINKFHEKITFGGLSELVKFLNKRNGGS